MKGMFAGCQDELGQARLLIMNGNVLKLWAVMVATKFWNEWSISYLGNVYCSLYGILTALMGGDSRLEDTVLYDTREISHLPDLNHRS